MEDPALSPLSALSPVSTAPLDLEPRTDLPIVDHLQDHETAPHSPPMAPQSPLQTSQGLADTDTAPTTPNRAEAAGLDTPIETNHIPLQPNHFYTPDGEVMADVYLKNELGEDAEGPNRFLTPETDAHASRGIPVFRPSMEEFIDFEEYMEKVEEWGMRSGIVKIIPPVEWLRSLPSLSPSLLSPVSIKNPIEQHFLGRGGVYKQENVEKRRKMSVREWVEMCDKSNERGLGVEDLIDNGRGLSYREPRKPRKKVPTPNVKEEQDEGTPAPQDATETSTTKASSRPTRADKLSLDEAFLSSFDAHKSWLPSAQTTTECYYDHDFCSKIEKRYWRSIGQQETGGPWYGADGEGTLFGDDPDGTVGGSWNIGRLDSALSRLLAGAGAGPTVSGRIPGVNTPYLYWGMWRATFAWHVEDMDLFSINYIHFGAPKFWYAIPQGMSERFEKEMEGFFGGAEKGRCKEWLRHKSFLVSPTRLEAAGAANNESQSKRGKRRPDQDEDLALEQREQGGLRVNRCVQRQQEIIITYPRGYHAGFNMGINCAESVNFALESWLELGRKAERCKCVEDSVHIDVDQLLRQREVAEAIERGENIDSMETDDDKPPVSRKRKNPESATSLLMEPGFTMSGRAKKIRVKAWPQPLTASATTNVTNKPAPKLKVKLLVSPTETFACVLCPSMQTEDLLPVMHPPVTVTYAVEGSGRAGEPSGQWFAHESCARIVPETWVDEIEVVDEDPGGAVSKRKKKVVYGVDAIVKDRWQLKCTMCTKPRYRSHGAPIQCTKGKCSKAFHVSCAREASDIAKTKVPTQDESTLNNDIVFEVLKEVEKEVVILDQVPPVKHLPDEMVVDAAGRQRAVNVVRKLEVKLLCHQHNPSTTNQKKINYLARMRRTLMSLPKDSRIKVRVAAGVFEVTLVSVDEEASSVEVIWDHGIKRVFKWSSIVFDKDPEFAGADEVPEGSMSSKQAVKPKGPGRAWRKKDIIIAGSKPTQLAPEGAIGPNSAIQPGWNLQQAMLTHGYGYATGARYPYDSYGYTVPGVTYPYNYALPATVGTRKPGTILWQPAYQPPPPGNASKAQPAQRSAKNPHPVAPNGASSYYQAVQQQTEPASPSSSSSSSPPVQTPPPLPASSLPTPSPAFDIAALAKMSQDEAVQFFQQNQAVRDMLLAALQATDPSASAAGAASSVGNSESTL